MEEEEEAQSEGSEEAEIVVPIVRRGQRRGRGQQQREVEAWIQEHFPMFRYAMNPNYTEDLPRAARWQSRREAKSATTVRYREMLDDVQATQFIPGPLSAPLRGSRGSTAATYSVVYQYTDALWQNWRDHLLHEDKRVPVRAGVPWESHNDYLPWFRTVSHLRVSPNRGDRQFIQIVEERNAAALAVLDTFLGGRTISTAACDMWTTILQVYKTLNGMEGGHPTTPTNPTPTSSS
ncbi:hypothetical protein RHMOL_Rhmol01G0253800 [Rhododendron molle]|uniref:Uncharacterized protein n=1 Tax=Rhododendron molle TaxID=49168 RepID=A0ACC0Q5T4_RHOML|nr:hypothetical protein RHMOL_Rhmol01G0253800 [Rhododendron molle]